MLRDAQVPVLLTLERLAEHLGSRADPSDPSDPSMAAVTGQEELAKLLAELEDLSEAQTPAEPGLVVLPFGPTG